MRTVCRKRGDPTDFPSDIAPADVLIDPIMVLQKVASLANDLLVIETHQDLLTLDQPAMGSTLHDDGSNWWGPRVCSHFVTC